MSGRAMARRALRVFTATGTVAAGLCLVIGLVGLILRAPGPGVGHLTASAPSAPQAQAGRATDREAAHRGARALASSKDGDPLDSTADLIAAFSGRGDSTTRQFRVDEAVRWQIQWTYRCPASDSAGILVVKDAGQSAVNISIRKSGAAGHGVTLLNPRGSTHRLVVISTCAWTMRVTQQQRAKGRRA